MHIPFVSKAKNRCSHQTKNGKPCNATPQKNKDYCFFHDPDRKEERTAARRQGGITSTHRGPLSLELADMPLQQASDVGRFLGRLVTQICLGNVEVRQGTGIAFITTCMMHAFDRARRDAENAVLGPLRGKRPGQMLASLLNPNGSAAAASFFQQWQMNANDDFDSPSEPDVAEELDDEQPGAPHSRPSASGNNNPEGRPKPDPRTGNSKPVPPAPVGRGASRGPETVLQTLLDKGGTPSHPKPEPPRFANAAGKGCAIQEMKPAPLTPAPVADDDHGKNNEPGATGYDEKAYREEGERLKKLQAEIIAKIESESRKRGQTPGAADSRPPWSEGNEAEAPTVSKADESAGLRALPEARKAAEEERRRREIEERKQLQKYQMERYGCCSPDLDFDFPALKLGEPNEIGIGQTYPVDTARKKLDADDFERKQQIAHALAPTTMQSSTITEAGVFPAPAETRPASTPAPPLPPRNQDNEPSPIPGLQNRHLNYMKYVGMPAWALKQMGIVFARR